MAFTHHWGWNDLPVFAFDGVYVNNQHINAADPRGGVAGFNTGAANGADNLVFDLAAQTAGGFGALGVRLMTPTDAVSAIAAGPGSLAAPLVDGLGGNVNTYAAQAQASLLSGNYEEFYRSGALLGGPTSIRYKQSHTTGMAIDYFEPWTGLVFRIESSITLDQLVNNTQRANWVDESDVMQWSIGLDRPTFIPWLNKDRTFFLSMPESFMAFSTGFMEFRK